MIVELDLVFIFSGSSGFIARGAAATNRASMEVVKAVQKVLAYTEEMGWSFPE